MTVIILIKRNIKLFFKDKGMFFTSLITPVILLVLYSAFLGEVYRESFTAGIPADADISEGLIDGLVAGQLVSSILAVSCVTVAFCSNFLMVQDKATGNIKDFRISPINGAVLSVSYYAAAIISTLIICLSAAAICLGYMGASGWHMTFSDVLCLVLDVVLLVVFGTALSSVINFFLTTQGQISAVGAMISAGYGFICGAYMPIASFGEGLRNVMVFLPGTYGTSLIREHCLDGVLAEMEMEGVPAAVTEGMRDSLDCNIYFSGSLVDEACKYCIVAAAAAVLLAVYILLNCLIKPKG